MNLSNEDVQDILSLLDTLPFGEFALETSQFALRLRRSEDGVWAQELDVLTEPATGAAPVPAGPRPATAPPDKPPVGPGDAPPVGPGPGDTQSSGPGDAQSSGPEDGLREVRAPLLGTFYRAPSPGAPPFVEVGGEVDQDTVVAIIETMKLMNPVYAGKTGTVAEICLADGEFAPQDAVLMRVSPRTG